MKILPDIKSSADVKKLRPEELEPLCAELRQAIIDSVSKNGGHLASNLGAVELTVALHRVYDTSRDRLVFDVGHQCYAHKMLTGRQDGFRDLRRLGGLSGFPKPSESPDDAFIAGHASTSVSVALGMARARTLTGGSYDVAAVIGDGSMTGGLAYEGLADCGESGEAIVIILNDNGMSINSNVGGIARLLSRLRVKPSYLSFKRFYRRTVGRIKPLYRLTHNFKEWLKELILPDNMFQGMGFNYLGPIDGHDVRALESAIAYAREQRSPVLLHVISVKGKGYAPAEACPELYHGVGPFDPASGVRLSPSMSFSSCFGDELTRLAAQDERIVAITAAMSSGTGLIGFEKRFPQRFFDVGIAEEHAVTMAAGMAKQGLKPVFAVYSSFLQRSFDMLIHDVSLSAMPVVFAVDRAGLVGADGETHQGSFDVSFLRTVPGMRIYAPASYRELRSMLKLALDGSGPAAIRYPRGGEGEYSGDSSGQDCCVLMQGRDVTIVSYGILINDALKAARELRTSGINAGVIKLNRLDKEHFDAVEKAAGETGRLVIAEEACERGCLGNRILACLVQEDVYLRGARLLNLGSGIVPHGEVFQLRRLCAIDSGAMIKAARELMEDRK